MKAGNASNAYTTGEVAIICRCSPRTVTGWCEKGRIEFWRIPGSRDRRIGHDSLVQFMRSNGFPEHMVPEPKPKMIVTEVAPNGQSPSEPLTATRALPEHHVLNVMLMTPRPDAAATKSLYDAIAAGRAVTLTEFSDWFSLGAAVQRQKPNVIVVVVEDWTSPALKAMLRSSFDDSDKFRDFACVAIAPLASTSRQCQEQVGPSKWHAVFRRPLLMDMLTRWVRSVMSEDHRLRIPEPAMYPPGPTDG